MKRCTMNTLKGILVLFTLLYSAMGYTDEKMKIDKSKETLHNSKTETSLMLTWNTSQFDKFDQEFKKEIYPHIHQLYLAGEVKYLLPFQHKPLNHPQKAGVWTSSFLIGLEHAPHFASISKILDLIHKSSLKNNLVAADFLSLQKGLDMFYSVGDGIKQQAKLKQIVEYVFSKPEAREKYYAEQYVFSGPAMQELHAQDKAGRFIGFEVVERLYGKDFPSWDLVHVVGFTKEQTQRATPIFMGVWDKHAARAFGEGMTFLKKKAEWDNIRLNVKSEATQNMTLTLPSPEN